MSAELERRYRAALDWYPKRWRDENGEAMLGTLLDEADASGREKPRLADLVNLALHGMAASATSLPDRVPAGIRDRAAAIGLGSGFALALVLFVGVEWAPWAANGPWNGWAFDWRAVHADVPGFGPFASAGVLLYALWFAAFGFALVGLGRIASFTLFATFPVILMLVENSGQRMAFLRPADVVLVSFAALALVAMLGRPTRRGHRAAGARWLAAAAGVAVVMPATFAVVAVLDARTSGDVRFEARMDPWNAWYQVANPVIILAVMGVAAGIAFARARRDWTLALVLSAIPWTISSMGLMASGGGVGLVAGCIVLGLTPVAVAYLVLRERGYRIALVRRD